MVPVRIDEIVRWTGGRLVGGDPSLCVEAISTDTRRLQGGECFVALVGERFDAHDFLREAIEKGARALVVEEGKVGRLPRPGGKAAPVAVVVTRDTTEALARIAEGYRSGFDVPVVAVTGSNGKTSTKNMIASVLATRDAVVATEKNYNNEVGLPLTLLRIEPVHRAVVVELGMRARGEIAALARTARPTVGVVTNVGPVHLESLGSLEAVAEAKGELVEALPPEGFAVLNGDDPRVRAMALRTRARVITYGRGDDVDAKVSEVVSHGLEGTSFTLTYRGARHELRLAIPGRHQVMNAAAAAVVALELGIDPAGVRNGLESARTGEMRLDVVRLQGGATLINDAYNASPASMRAALELLAEVPAARRLAVLGDMLELGTATVSAHEELGADAARAGVDRLAVVGAQAQHVCRGALASGLAPEQVVSFADADQAAAGVCEWVEPGDLILIKGSRGVRLERVAERLIEARGRAKEREDSL